MNISTTIAKGTEVAHALKLNNRADALKAEEIALAQERYKVAFVGQFKVGKSTLINRIILKEDLLFTDVLEATSVPTEIEYGTEPRLDVFVFERQDVSISLPDQAPVSDSVVTGVRLSESISNPTADIIRRYTCGDTPEERTELAHRVSHVRLVNPATNLRGYTVVDTAGTNSTTEAVITTTYRIIPTCDLTILVVQPKGLSQIDTDFLQGKIFSAGIARCMVVINYDSRFGEVEETQLERIRKAIVAQLSVLGRSNIPVSIAEGVSGGNLRSGALAAEIQQPASVDPFADWPGGSSSSSPSPAAFTSPTSFEAELVSYIRDNIRPAREEKAAFRVKRVLSGMLTEISIEITAINQSESDRATALSIAREAHTTTRSQYESLKVNFLADLRAIQKIHQRDITRGMDSVMQQFYSRLDAANSLADTQTVITSSKAWMQSEIESLVADVGRETRQHLQQLQQDYSVRWADAGRAWNDVELAIKLDGGIFEKVPPFLVNIMDYGLAILVMPFPFFIDIIIRLIAQGIPGLKQILPAVLATNILKSSVKSSCQSQYTKILAQTNEQLISVYSEAETRIEHAWNDAVQEQERAILNPLERSQIPNDAQRLELLENSKSEIQSLIALI